MSSDAEILAARAPGKQEPDPRRWAALIVMLLAGFMNLLDVSIVNIAIPSIQRSLHASYADVQWTLGGSIGLALIGVIFFGFLGSQAGPATVSPAFRAAHFAVAASRTLWYQVGVFLLAFLLMLALPARRRHNITLDSVRDDGREPRAQAISQA